MPLKLTNNEKKVLVSLIKHPHANDGKLSELTGVKKSSVAAIKARLKKQGIYSTRVVPDFQRLGAELITLVFGKFSPETKIEARRKTKAYREVTAAPELVYARNTNTEFSAVCVSKNITDTKRLVDYLISSYGKYEFFEEFNMMYCPIELSKIYRFFDYTELAGQMFKVK